MSFFHRFSQEATNAVQDLYGNIFLGDDAGKSARLTLTLDPNPGTSDTNINDPSNLSPADNPYRSKTKAGGDNNSLAHLGMTFLEVNGRAYVQTVLPGSLAFQAGVMPQDAVQYAILYQRELMLEHMQEQNQKRQQRQEKDRTNNNSHSYDDMDHADLLDNVNVNMDSVAGMATQYALEQETQGIRISYDGLRQVLVEAMEPVVQSAFVSPPVTRTAPSPSNWNGPPIPSTVSVCVNNTNYNRQSRQPNQQSPTQQQLPSSPSDQKPLIVFVFRRTRQRKSLHHMMTMLPSFRLDDECDFASSLVKRLAPTADMEIPPPDTWEELVHDGTDWLLGSGSMLPPKQLNNPTASAALDNSAPAGAANAHSGILGDHHDNSSIPLDDFERERAKKLANLRSKMAAEAMQVDRTEDVEAATIRGMIQKAVGLAFVRASKVVLGVSIHGGSGIVIARLSDGTWSAPSAIGTWGLGLGLQFGLEVAEYIFILQTQESLDHFRSGGSFTIGGNIGAAVAGMGREAYGAASAGGTCGGLPPINDPYDKVHRNDDEYNDDNDSRYNNEISGAAGMMNYLNCAQPRPQQGRRNGAFSNTNGNQINNGSNSLGVAPIVAYAKSQGLYIGVSLEGSRIFVRNDINSRTYKFTCGRDVSAYDILSGKVSTPPEAEDLYAALHSVEFTHEMSCLPRPPEVLRKDSPNAWYYDRSTLGGDDENNDHDAYNENNTQNTDPFNFLSTLNHRDTELCETFETQFKKFMYGGVSVQRLLPNTESRSGRTRRERRTLWLMLPEVGSLRLGYVSKLSDGESSVAVSNKSSTLRARRDDPSITGGSISGGKNLGGGNDLMTVESEEVTLDSALFTDKGDGASTLGGGGTSGGGAAVGGGGASFGGGGQNNSIRTAGNVQLSNKHSVALTDLTILSQDPLVPIRFNPEDQTEHLRVISMQDVYGTSLLFLANNFREAELLVCGLKLLLERETVRLGVRGGLPITTLGGRTFGDSAMSPTAARGFRNHRNHNEQNNNDNNNVFLSSTSSQAQIQQYNSKTTHATQKHSHRHPNSHNHRYRDNSRKYKSNRSTSSGYSSSDDVDTHMGTEGSEEALQKNIPEGRRSWGNVPGRSYMRVQAAASHEQNNDINNNNMNTNNNNYNYHRSDNSASGASATAEIEQQFVHNQLLVRDIARNVLLPLPLPLCRVMILDSKSPLITKWENDRGDINFQHTPWVFPPATPRELERHSSEHQLIATGSMCGAHRTITFDRMRSGTYVRLSETEIVDADDSEKLAITVTERMPRRGFSIRVRILLRAVNNKTTLATGKQQMQESVDATVFVELRPVGKDLSNQSVVQKAFQLVLNEIRARYDVTSTGLMGGFLHVIANMGAGGAKNATATSPTNSSNYHHRPFSRTNPSSLMMIEEKKVDGPNNHNSNKNNFDDANNGRRSKDNNEEGNSSTNNNNVATRRASNSGLVSFSDMLNTGRQSPEMLSNAPLDRPSTPSILLQLPEPDPSKRLKEKNSTRSTPNVAEFGPNTSLATIPSSPSHKSPKNSVVNSNVAEANAQAVDFKNEDTSNAIENLNKSKEQQAQPLLIEVKPLPKIRLSLMPSPREEDEENDSSNSAKSPSGPSAGSKKQNKKSKKSSTSKRRANVSSWRKTGRPKT